MKSIAKLQSFLPFSPQLVLLFHVGWCETFCLISDKWNFVSGKLINFSFSAKSDSARVALVQFLPFQAHVFYLLSRSSRRRLIGKNYLPRGVEKVSENYEFHEGEERVFPPLAKWKLRGRTRDLLRVQLLLIYFLLLLELPSFQSGDLKSKIL